MHAQRRHQRVPDRDHQWLLHDLDVLPVIVLEGVYKNFGSKRVLADMNLRVERGETFVIIGPSGIGKSVTLKHIVGLVKPDRGRVIVADVDVGNANGDQLYEIRSKIGFLFQSGALINWLTVSQNVALPMVEHTSLSQFEITRRVDELLAQVQMLHARDQFPGQVSGGMRKRAALARVLAGTPSIILYDEPTAGLDPVMTNAIAKLIRRVQRDFQVTSIVVTHDLPCAYEVADRIGMVHEGHLIEMGTVDHLRNSTNPVVSHFIRGQANDDPT
jgi:phospholipid/cholesterol/gamma-HCH transport system ATP-binding protein